VKERLEKLWVSPSFKKKMFYEAKVIRGMTVADYSRLLANQGNSLKDKFGESKVIDTKTKSKRFKFDF